MSNSVHSEYLRRLIAIETERRDNAEDRKGLMAEMKKLPKHERKGIQLRAKWDFESEEQAKDRQMSFDFAESLGEPITPRMRTMARDITESSTAA